MANAASASSDEVPSPPIEPLFTPLTKGPHGMYRQVKGAFIRHGRKADFKALNSKTSACITVYNEGGEQLETTLKRGVCENMAAMNERKDDLGSLDVHIVVDGFAMMSDSMKETLARLNLFDAGCCSRQFYAGKQVEAYYFFNTIELKHSEVATEEQRYPKLNVHVIVKRHNMQKLNSHFWFFRGCCKITKPTYVVTLDCGTKPSRQAMERLIAELEYNPSYAGVCGELRVQRGSACNLVVQAQRFEYKISSIMDKTLESIFGYVPCLPGAFSAYRFAAIEGQPLNTYLSPAASAMTIAKLGPSHANAALAEDRLLSAMVMSKQQCEYRTMYVAGAHAVTDVPTTLLDLIKQRRRWLNGTFCAMMLYLISFRKVMAADHNILRKFMLALQFFVLFVMTLFAFLGPLCLYLSAHTGVHVVATQFAPQYTSEITFAFSLVYVNVGMRLLISTLGDPNGIQHSRRLFEIVAMVQGLVMLAGTTVVAYHAVVGTLGLHVRLATTLGFGCYVLVAVVYGCPAVLLAMPAYIALLPTFINVFALNSFCNFDKLSWGTRPSPADVEQELIREVMALEVVSQPRASFGTIVTSEGQTSSTVTPRRPSGGSHRWLQRGAAGSSGRSLNQPSPARSGAGRSPMTTDSDSSAATGTPRCLTDLEVGLGFREQEMSTPSRLSPSKHAVEVDMLAPFVQFRNEWLQVWLACNALPAIVVVYMDLAYVVLWGVLMALTAMLLLRTAGALLFAGWQWWGRFWHCFCCCCSPRARRRRRGVGSKTNCCGCSRGGDGGDGSVVTLPLPPSKRGRRAASEGHRVSVATTTTAASSVSVAVASTLAASPAIPSRRQDGVLSVDDVELAAPASTAQLAQPQRKKRPAPLDLHGRASNFSQVVGPPNAS